MNKLKQVLLVRKHLQMNPGKMGAQISHASRSAIFSQMQDSNRGKFLRLTRYERQWYDGPHTTIVKWVKNENQLLKAYEKAKEMGFPCALIKDMGLTVFDEPTLTTVGIGPADFNQIQKITKRFQLVS